MARSFFGNSFILAWFAVLLIAGFSFGQDLDLGAADSATLAIGTVQTARLHPISVPVSLTSTGTAVSASLTLKFDPALLSATASDVSIGSGPLPTGCGASQMSVNPNALGSGRLGIAINCSTSGAKIPAGTSILFNVRFTPKAAFTTGSTAITFDNSPLNTEVGDANGNIITPLTQTPGSITLVNYDGDINRDNPNVPGYGDGQVDQQDLFWYDQFSRGLHCPADDPNEFQCLDGNDNGSIDGGDYTYITNVFLGILPKAGAKGPSAKPANLCFGVPTESRTEELISSPATGDEYTPMSMQLTSSVGRPGTDIEIYLDVSARGDERTTSTSIRWDPAVMTIANVSGFANPDVFDGPGAVYGQLRGVNAGKVADGLLGVLVDFTGGAGNMAIKGGRSQILGFRFHILPDAQPGTISRVELTAAGPTAEQTVNTNGQIVSVEHTEGGSVLIQQPLKRPSKLMRPTQGTSEHVIW